MLGEVNTSGKTVEEEIFRSFVMHHLIDAARPPPMSTISEYDIPQLILTTLIARKTTMKNGQHFKESKLNVSSRGKAAPLHHLHLCSGLYHRACTCAWCLFHVLTFDSCWIYIKPMIKRGDSPFIGAVFTKENHLMTPCLKKEVLMCR